MHPEHEIRPDEYLDWLAANDCTFSKDDLYAELSKSGDPGFLIPGFFDEDDNEPDLEVN